MEQAESLPFADDPILSALATHWSGLRRGRRTPARADISPLEIPRAVLLHRHERLPASSKLIPSATMDRNVHRLVRLPEPK